MNKRTKIKMGISASIVLLAVIAALVIRSRYALLALPGMLFGFHGDLCLAKIPPLKKLYRDPFIVGAGSFLIGHIFYIAAFLSAMEQVPVGPLWASITLYSIATFAAWMAAAMRAKGSAFLSVGLLIYALTIGVMASFAFALAHARGGVFWLTALAGLLFVVSDGLIAVKDFIGKPIPHGDAWIWATYAPAQFLIIFSGFFVS